MLYLFTLPTGFSFQLIRSICNANLFFREGPDGFVSTHGADVAV